MKYIKYIDDYCANKTATTKRVIGGQVVDSYVIAKPEEATGLLKWKIRIVQAVAILKGKAIAVKFWNY